MNKPRMQPRWTRATMAALWATVIAGGATCNVISGADSVEFTGESTSSSGGTGSSSSTSSSGGTGSISSTSSSGGTSSGGYQGNSGTCPGESVSVKPGLTFPLIVGNTTGASDKITGSKGNYPGCTNCDCMMSTTYTGPDLVYAVTPSASGTLSVTLDATYSDWQLNVRTKCAGNTPSDEVACVWGYDPGSTAANPNDLSFPVIQGTTYYVFANSWDGVSVGQFTLELSLQ